MRIGPYEVTGELGRGAAGVVYAARAPDGREVAVKLLLGGEGITHARFEREVAALRELDHPGIVPLLDEGEHAGRRYLVTPRVAGASLQARLDRAGPLDDAQAARLALELCRALAHAHSRALLHRDVKPDNVLIDEAGAHRLVDFGLARTIDRSSLTASGQFVGSPGFWSPEQARGARDVGPATDVYGLGATLYAALTGSPPHVGATLAEVFVQTTEHAPRAPSSLRVGVARELERLCLRCLEKDPARRPTLADVEAALVAWLERPDGRRSPAPWLVHAALGLLGGGALLTLAATRARTDPLVAPAAASATVVPPPSPPEPAPVEPAPSRSDARRWTEEGSRLHEAGDHDAAAQAFGEVIALTPSVPEAWVNRAVARRAAGDLDGALADARHAAELDPEHVPAWALIGELFYAQRDYQRAMLALDAGLLLDPDSVRLLIARGLVARNLGDHAQARADCDRVLAIDPDNVDGLVNRANLRRDQLGDPAGALEDLDRAVALDPRLPEARLSRAMSRMAAGDAAGAEEDATAALAVAPSALAYSERAKARRALDDLRGALADYSAAIDRQPANHAYRFNRGNLHRDMGDHAAALADFQRSIELSPEFLAGWANLGSLRLDTGDVDGGVTALERALALARTPEERAKVERMLARARR